MSKVPNPKMLIEGGSCDVLTTHWACICPLSNLPVTPKMAKAVKEMRRWHPTVNFWIVNSLSSLIMEFLAFESSWPSPLFSRKSHAIQSIILSSQCFQDESTSVCQRILSDTAWNSILFRLLCFLSFKLSLTFGDMLQGYLPYLCKPPFQTFYSGPSATFLFI